MSHSVRHDPENDMVIAEIMGRIGLSDLQEAGKEIARIAKQVNCQYILTDLREANLKVTVVEMYFLPQYLTQIARAHELGHHHIKRAFVAAKDQNVLRFYETTASNQGHQTRLFYDLEEAKYWLLEDTGG